jgi:hypothetical protein
MRFLVMVKPPPAAYEAGGMPSSELVAKMGAFNAELADAGMLLAAEGLYPSSQGARITFAAGKPTVIDGPFTESKELIGGFWLLQVKSKDEAVAWLSRCPFEGNEEIELRQIREVEDFAAAMRDSAERSQ